MMKKATCGLTFLLLLLVFPESSFSAHTITTWPGNKKGALSLTFDDVCDSQLTVGIPELNARGMKGTFFVVTDWVVTWDPWVNASSAGHEIGSHTMSHPHLTTLSLPQMQDEMAGAKALIDANITSQKCLSFAYPYGEFNSNVQSIAQNNYPVARGVICELNQEPFDFYNVRACSPDDGDDIYTYADLAETQRKWGVVFFHCMDSDHRSYTESMFTAYLDYLKTKNLWVGDFGTIVKYIKEKSSATLAVLSSSSDQIVLTLTDTMDDAIYNQPLTIRSEVPSDWITASIQQGSSITTVNSTVEGASRVIYYDAIPDRGPISLQSVAPTGFLEDGTGLVSMEAEHNQANVPVGNYAWMPVTNSGYTGSGALQILPDDGPNPAIAGAGPRLDYQVQFTKTGTHYIWIRALSNSLDSDSLYVGLDGATAGASDMSGLIVDGVTWTWTNLKRSGDVATVNVTFTGVHTVNVWMRESGIVLDKLVLSTSASYVPTGTGPAESASTAAAPAVTTNPATSATSSGASLNGGVNPNGAATTAWFEWGTSATLTTFSSTSTQALGSGTTSQAVTAALSGLSSGTTYYFRVAASNSAGTVKGSIASFSTTAAAAAPTVTTNAATSVTVNSATLNGGVNPNGRSTNAWFEWGTSATLSTFSSTASQSLGSGTASQAVTATLSGLSSGTTYYFRVAASNSAGTVKGSIASFSTTAAAAAPTVTTSAATSVTVEWGGAERRGEPERPIDQCLVRVGHQRDPVHLQQHCQPVPRIRDGESGGHRDAVGLKFRDDVLFPGGGLQFRRNRQGIDRQFQHHGGGSGRVPGGWQRPGFHGGRTLSGQCPRGQLCMDAGNELRILRQWRPPDLTQ